jgi:predicted DNA binding CopG/RHH family protein
MNKKQAISKMPTKKEKGIDPAYYENHCFAKDMAEAEKEGNLIVTRKGENALQSIKRYLAEKKKTASVTMRLPVYVVNMAKAQAKKAGVPYTSFIGAIIETAMAKPLRRMA